MSKFVVLVCGGRDYGDRDHVFNTLDDVLNEIVADGDDMFLIQGGAAGADSIAWEWGVINRLWVKTYEADWDTHKRAAGPIRNKEMLEAEPDLIIAFPGDVGTNNMITQGQKAGIPVRKIAPRGLQPLPNVVS